MGQFSLQGYLKGVKTGKDELVDEYAAVLADVLGILPYQLKQIDAERLGLVLNADFSRLNTNDKVAINEAAFVELIADTNMAGKNGNDPGFVIAIYIYIYIYIYIQTYIRHTIRKTEINSPSGVAFAA